MKFATTFMRHYPPHLKHVATLPWEIKNSNFFANIQQIWKNANKLQFIASNFVVHPQIFMF